MNFLFYIVFIFTTVFILVKTISYALYEINTENNKYGGIAVIFFSILVVVFANIVVFIRY